MEEEKKNFILNFEGFKPLGGKKKKKKPKKLAGAESPVKKTKIDEDGGGKEEREQKKCLKEISQTSKKSEPSRSSVKSLQSYALEKESLLEIPTTTHEQLPSMKDVLSYISHLPTRPFWYQATQENIINSNALKKIPNLDVLTRGYIKPFLKSGPYPCKNIRCESERLGGFRLRILQMPGKSDGVWCFLCHLFETNKLYFESLNRKHDSHNNYQIHYFMVQVDVPGEYRLDRTLDNEKDVRGLYGPFPIYNVNNYRKHPSQNEWIESDALVFRPTQTMSSNPIESCSTTKKDKGNSYFQIVGKNDSQKLYLESQQ
jgi:hypothetical protein